MMNCDPVTGACQLPDPNTETPKTGAVSSPAQPLPGQGFTLHYIGDPMCSWCWGLSPTLDKLRAYASAQGMGFQITVGGLRAGGGDAWNEPFKAFLRNEWRHIHQVTGQPFVYTLLDLPHFEYDTEPACRAVVALQRLQDSGEVVGDRSLAFFAAIQHRFYAEGQDPKDVAFYVPVCAQVGVPFEAFRASFESADTRAATHAAFMRCRRWGVRSFPTLVLETPQGLQLLGQGYLTADEALHRLDRLVAASTPKATPAGAAST